MPTYEYACKSCGETLEVSQSFTDPALTACPSCDGPLRKVFGSVGIVLKGSGFYRTDSRGPAPSEGGAAKDGAKEGTSPGSRGAGGSSGSEARGSEARGSEAKKDDGGSSGSGGSGAGTDEKGSSAGQTSKAAAS